MSSCARPRDGVERAARMAPERVSHYPTHSREPPPLPRLDRRRRARHRTARGRYETRAAHSPPQLVAERQHRRHRPHAGRPESLCQIFSRGRDHAPASFARPRLAGADDEEFSAFEDRRGQRRPGRQAHLAGELGEQHDLASRQRERVQAMPAVRERLIADGRSTPGIPQKNVPVKRIGG